MERESGDGQIFFLGTSSPPDPAWRDASEADARSLIAAEGLVGYDNIWGTITRYIPASVEPGETPPRLVRNRNDGSSWQVRDPQPGDDVRPEGRHEDRLQLSPTPHAGR